MIAHSSINSSNACFGNKTLLLVVVLSPSRLTHPSPPLPPVATTRSLSTNYRHRRCSTCITCGDRGATSSGGAAGHGRTMRGHGSCTVRVLVYVKSRWHLFDRRKLMRQCFCDNAAPHVGKKSNNLVDTGRARTPQDHRSSAKPNSFYSRVRVANRYMNTPCALRPTPHVCTGTPYV